MLIIGNSGVGKTVVIQDYLASIVDSGFVTAQANLSAQTTSNNLQVMKV